MTDAIRQWYEQELGWPVSGTAPVELPTGVRFDVLELPADAGRALLRRMPGTGPVAVAGRRMQLLVAAGGAEELPGLLDWLEWGGVPLELTALGAGGLMTAPVPPASAAPHLVEAAAAAAARTPGITAKEALQARPGPDRGRPAGSSPQEAAAPVWLRPPEPGRRLEPTLPATGFGGDGCAPDLARLVGAAATECHRARLLAVQRAQPLAFSYASRTVAGTRPRSLTS
ncbi:SCO3374 family protein [Streptomyces palmae]|uniref:Proline-rich protein n=1 Tax=Streptomyces palmae TaxID=1701085 RepID=A0A4Z0HDL0_9ACTN|nr:SCO3374 family protein [Streptomyces palmae]TGB11187.1 hypothetical protein E4099_12245 [Streptomyces palmae]